MDLLLVLTIQESPVGSRHPGETPLIPHPNAFIKAIVRKSSSSSQSDLIAKILATLQPRITSAVQSAVGQTTTRVAPRPAAPRPAAPRPVTFARRPLVAVAPPRVSSFSGSADQSSIVSSVINSLSPRISSAVTSALAGSNR